jgi:predicted HicB family RNase H-like nuclease
MNSKHRKTLDAIFTDPVNGNLPWDRIEALRMAVGCRIIEGTGSVVLFEKDGKRAHFHPAASAQGSAQIPRQGGTRVLGKNRSHAMKNAISYRGYTASIEFDWDDRILVGRVLDIDDIITFHGTSIDEFDQAFRNAIDHYIAACERLGQEAEKPASGRLIVCVAPEVHAAAIRAASRSGQSLNKWAERVLREAAHT